MGSTNKSSKGQRSLTSFFSSRLKDRLQKETDRSPKSQESEIKLDEEADCIILSPDKADPEAEPRTSPHFGRPAKRLKLEHDYSSGEEEVKVSQVQQGSSTRLVGGCQIPGRVAKTHARFQSKLVEGIGDKRNKGADSIVPQKHTPLELQVVELKKKYPDILLIIEVGYKFRFFGKDAEIAASTCNIFCYPDRNFMTASVPVPRLHVYIRRLVAAGHKVGIVRQTETAALKAAGDNKYAPFSRTLTALYTRSTLEAGDREDIGALQGTEASEAAHGSAWASEGLNNYLVCLVEQAQQKESEDAVTLGIVAVETSTGTIKYDEFRDGQLRAGLEAHLMFTPPSELLVAQPVSNSTRRLLGTFSQAVQGLKAEYVDGDKYATETAEATLQAFYASGSAMDQKATDLAALETLPPLVMQALAHALDYLKQFQLEAIVQQKCAFKPFSEADELSLSPNALQQLEVLRNSEDGSERGSLLWLVNHTKTAMGSRLMRSWVSHPLKRVHMINERLDAVQELAADDGTQGSPLERLRACLAGLPDLERGITRILHCTASPSEFLQIMQSFNALIADLGVQAGEAAREMLQMIDATAAEQNDKIGFLRDKQKFPEVCACRTAVEDRELDLADLLPKIARLIRVPRLEYKSIMNQGDYLIEVDALRTDIPKGWEKVSSTKKLNRYRPPEVTAAVQQLELAKERLQVQAEKDYTGFLASFKTQYTPFRSAVSALAALDVLQSLALVSNNEGYVRPEFVDLSEPAQLSIEEGRHPVLDAALDTPYVTNDTTLSNADGQYGTQIITGPNMGGKSSYIRQVALIVILAQMGSFVPAKKVSMRAITAIFTRMGASDNLAQGRSTFLEELSETSTILAQADESSLVVIDELGRGTSTHDGVAIAYATLKHVIQGLRPLTLFVTHYPQVASVIDDAPGRVYASYMSFVQDVEPEGDERQPKITFLFKLVPGIADRSFGLNVARMAHLPAKVVQRAAVKAAQMEEEVTGVREISESVRQVVHGLKVCAALPESVDAAVRLLQLHQQLRSC